MVWIGVMMEIGSIEESKKEKKARQYFEPRLQLGLTQESCGGGWVVVTSVSAWGFGCLVPDLKTGG